MERREGGFNTILEEEDLFNRRSTTAIKALEKMNKKVDVMDTLSEEHEK